MIEPYWKSADGRHVIYNADCLQVLPELEAGSVDAVVTDPPYSSGGAFRGDRTNKVINKYVRSSSHDQYTDFGGDSRDQRSFLAWSSLWMAAARVATKSGGVIVSFSDWRQLPVMTDCVQSGGWCWRNIGTWWKPGCRMQRGRFSSSAEFIVYGTNGPHCSDGELSPQNVFMFSTMQTSDKEHIAEKPIEVVQWCVGATRKSSAVIDPFMGSGTTGVACVRTNRRFIGIEIEKRYCDIAVKRMERELSQPMLPFAAPEEKVEQAMMFDEAEDEL